MKVAAYAAVLLGLVSAALAQETPGPSPTESFGCEPHGDHWHCEGARPTDAEVITSSSSSAAAVTTTATVTSTHVHDDDEDHEEHTDAAGTASLAPSPTESIGCEPHGDHWHCEGPATAGTSGAGGAATTTPPASTGTGAAASTSSLPSTAAAPRFEVAGLGFAGIAAAAAMAL